MRVEFFEVGSYHTARKRAPWAAVCSRVFGGFICFESVTDYKVFRGQR